MQNHNQPHHNKDEHHSNSLFPSVITVPLATWHLAREAKELANIAYETYIKGDWLRALQSFRQPIPLPLSFSQHFRSAGVGRVGLAISSTAILAHYTHHLLHDNVVNLAKDLKLKAIAETKQSASDRAMDSIFIENDPCGKRL